MPKPKPKRYAVSNNSNAIITLARQVKSLQVSKIGPDQKRIENIEIDHADMGSNNYSPGRPICWQLNDFTSDNKLWTVNTQSHNAEQLHV